MIKQCKEKCSHPNYTGNNSCHPVSPLSQPYSISEVLSMKMSKKETNMCKPPSSISPLQRKHSKSKEVSESL